MSPPNHKMTISSVAPLMCVVKCTTALLKDRRFAIPNSFVANGRWRKILKMNTKSDERDCCCCLLNCHLFIFAKFAKS